MRACTYCTCSCRGTYMEVETIYESQFYLLPCGTWGLNLVKLRLSDLAESSIIHWATLLAQVIIII